ncbi:hypothetical protein EV148_103382 [Dokdonella fugitiva]|uniref:Uncharacterized protein n=1 Tax=Dokdonella fugitiva TaxID=328517 RepID=A0A4R2IBF9_9GAMM|nr:hypothetical protein EV148_103382 [Dokdonella fugitiva]
MLRLIGGGQGGPYIGRKVIGVKRTALPLGNDDHLIAGPHSLVGIVTVWPKLFGEMEPVLALE